MKDGYTEVEFLIQQKWVVKIPRSDQCCLEDVDTSGYKGELIDTGIEDNIIVDEEEDKEGEEVVI